MKQHSSIKAPANTKPEILIHGERNTVESDPSSAPNATIDIIGNDNLVQIHTRARLGDVRIILRGDRHRLFIASDVHMQAGLLRLIHGGCLLALGARTTIVEAEMICFEVGTKIVIGKDCLISKGVHAWTGDAHSVVDAETGKRLNYGRDIQIADQVWIGYQALLLKGATIGRGSILGARSVLGSEVPPLSLAAGNPARIIKSNVTWKPDVFYEPGVNPKVHTA